MMKNVKEICIYIPREPCGSISQKMHSHAVKGCSPLMLSLDTMDRFVYAQPCKYFAEKILWPLKDRKSTKNIEIR